MTTTVAPLAGYRGLRGEVLVALKKAQPLTAKELGQRFGVTPNALRRHLKALEAEGMVCFRREARGVGGPVFAYVLTDRGEGLFPRAYEPMLAHALERVREQSGPEGVEQFFLERWRLLLAEAGPALAALPAAERSRMLAELLSGQGYMAESATAPANELRIIEHNCVMHELVRRFPEICAAEAKFLAEVLGGTVERQSHMATGCNHCEYRVRL